LAKRVRTAWLARKGREEETVRYQERVVQDALDEERLPMAYRRVTPSLALGGILAVPLDVLAMSVSHLLVRDKIWLPEKKSQMRGLR